MKRDKEQAFDRFLEVIRKSWTYLKMTEAEQEAVYHCLARAQVFGTYEQRYQTYCEIYNAFLTALGYDGAGWRATEEERATMPRF